MDRKVTKGETTVGQSELGNVRIVLGLVLFNIFISNIGTKSKSVLIKFTDDKMLGNIIYTEKEQDVLQK